MKLRRTVALRVLRSGSRGATRRGGCEWSLGKKVQCIKVRGGYKKRYGCIGDIVTVSVKIAQPHSMVKKGEIYQAVLVRARKETRRKDGSYIRFSDSIQQFRLSVINMTQNNHHWRTDFVTLCLLWVVSGF
jgi:ribosomal protein L14